MSWLDALRIITVSLGGLVIGFTLYAGFLYGRGDLHSGVYRRARHVVAISLAFILFATEEIIEISDNFGSTQLHWQLPYTTLIFMLGTYALFSLVRTRAAHREGVKHD